MKKISLPRRYFTKGELLLWGGSVLLILLSFFLFDRRNYMTLAASLIGAASLIFGAKGNPIGPLLMIFFSILYGVISLSFAYYGEMITYLGMTLPMAVFALLSWLRHPYKGKRSQVAVNRIRRGEIVFLCFLTAIVTVAFYFILTACRTANLLPSTLSVSTSFVAVYLTFRRSPYYALAYAANDVILILLWILAGMTDLSYLSVMTCFFVFLANDLYGFYNWLKMRKQQQLP